MAEGVFINIWVERGHEWYMRMPNLGSKLSYGASFERNVNSWDGIKRVWKYRQ